MRSEAATLGVRVDEWGRFCSELTLLGAWNWEQYGVAAMDSMHWSFRAHDVFSADAGGVGAFPPRSGSDGDSSALDRLFLIFERLVGRTIWLETDYRAGLADIPEPCDRVEHMLLAAGREWARAMRYAELDPSTLTERLFQAAALRPHVERLGPCVSERAPQLADWSPGKVDLVIGDDAEPVWVELKWCRSPDTFGNCVWDAGKLAAAVREGRTKYGYLLVGAPVSVWKQRGNDGRVMDVSCHPGDTLVTEHASWWRLWLRENKNTFPRRLPTPVITTPVGRVRYFGVSEPWELRLARVEAPGTEDYDPVAVLA